jgi:hypothetical protein
MLHEYCDVITYTKQNIVSNKLFDRRKELTIHKQAKQMCLAFGYMLFISAIPAQAGLFDKAPNPVMLQVQGNRGEEFKQLVHDDSALDKAAKLTAGEPVKVAIAKVRLNFATQSSASSTEKRSFGSSSDYMDYSLVGVKPEDVQKMADIFYDDLAKLLKSKGYIVEPKDYLMSDSNFAKAVLQTKSPDSSEGLVKKEKAVTAYAKQTAQFSGLGNGGIDYNALSRAKSEAIILELDLDVDFVAISKASDKGVWFQMNQIEAKPVLHVKNGFVRIHLNGQQGVHFPFLEKAILPGEVFAKVEKKENTATETVVADAVATVGALMGLSGHENSYLVTPVKNFPEAVAKSLQPFEEVVINALPKPTSTLSK